MFIHANETVLFQGDSVTDMDRLADPRGIGVGYVYSTISGFCALHPEMNVRFINRGISGNRVKDLQARWKEDALDLNPDVLSILIGINDTWRRFDSNDPTSTQAYEDSYRDILTQSRAKNPNLKIILMDPFMLSAPIGDPKEWRQDLNPRIAVVEKLAKEFGVSRQVIVQDIAPRLAALLPRPSGRKMESTRTRTGARLSRLHGLEPWERFKKRKNCAGYAQFFYASIKLFAVFRYSRGAEPVSCLNTRPKWVRLSNPLRIATSPIDNSLSGRSVCAKMTR